MWIVLEFIRIISFKQYKYSRCAIPLNFAQRGLKIFNNIMWIALGLSGNCHTKTNDPKSLKKDKNRVTFLENMIYRIYSSPFMTRPLLSPPLSVVACYMAVISYSSARQLVISYFQFFAQKKLYSSMNAVIGYIQLPSQVHSLLLCRNLVTLNSSFQILSSCNFVIS